MVEPQPPITQATLEQALAVVRPLVLWMLRNGVDYKAFATALKPVFLAEALAETERQGGKVTDSAMSLMSGLHRKDVRSLWAVLNTPAAGTPGPASRRPSTANRLVTRWLTELDGQALPFSGPSPSFETLALAVSVDVRPRAVLGELLRLGVVQEADGWVRLQQQAFVADPAQHDAVQLAGDNMADHLAAAVHNLSGPPGRRHLEQSVFADGLSEDSIRQLSGLANQLWHQVLNAVVTTAQPLCEQDEARGGTQRFRMGLYSYTDSLPPQGPPPLPLHTDHHD